MQGETAALEAETIRAVERLKEEAAAKEKAAKADPKKSGSSGKEEKAEEKAPAPKEKETVDPEKEDPAGPSSFWGKNAKRTMHLESLLLLQQRSAT